MLCNTCNIKMTFVVQDLFECPKCSLTSSKCPPDVSLYDRSYLRKYERYSKTQTGKNIDEFRSNFVSSVQSKKAPILDFGCGSGSFVYHMRRLNYSIEGFDINPYSRFCDISKLFAKYNTVTFWDSIEHLTDPKSVILGLNPDVVIISTPSTDGCDNSILTWRHYYPGEHLFYYNYKSLLALLTECGYTYFQHSYEESEYRVSGNPKNILTIGAFRG